MKPVQNDVDGVVKWSELEIQNDYKTLNDSYVEQRGPTKLATSRGSKCSLKDLKKNHMNNCD